MKKTLIYRAQPLLCSVDGSLDSLSRFPLQRTRNRALANNDTTKHRGGGIERFSVTGSDILRDLCTTDRMTIVTAVNARAIRDHCPVDCALSGRVIRSVDHQLLPKSILIS